MARRTQFLLPSRTLFVLVTLTTKRTFRVAFPSPSWATTRIDLLQRGRSWPSSSSSASSSFHSSTACSLNRFLFSSNEVDASHSVPMVTLSKDDYRTVHASKILRVSNGDAIRAGIVSSEHQDGMLTDVAIVEWIPEGKVLKSEPLRNGNPPGSLRIHLHALQSSSGSGPSSSSSSSSSSVFRPPRVSLILALPRPIQLARMLPMISQMGVEHLILTDARKVPKDYFGSHLFRSNPQQPPHQQLYNKLIEGLCQSGDVQMPQVHLVHHLNQFLNDNLDQLFPLSDCARAIAHPQRTNAPPLPRMRHIQFPSTSSHRKLVVAVGPEGGWDDPTEIDRFCDLGFQKVTMGERTLRSDCAVISLLSLAHDVVGDEAAII